MMEQYENFTESQLEEWVQDILLGYAAKGYSQEDVRQLGGHFCHHPLPGCLGGNEGIYLFEEDHAVHGTLQSEVFQHPCIYGWESKYLTGDLYALCKKWHTEKGKRSGSKNAAAMNSHPNTKEKNIRNGKMNVRKMLNHPNRIPGCKKGGGKNTELQQQARSRSITEYNKSPEARKNRSKRGKEAAKVLNSHPNTIKTRKENSKAFSVRWMSTEDGFVSSASGVARHNRARGWDPKARIKVG